jgi:SAM-dependent methyltransferase
MEHNHDKKYSSKGITVIDCLDCGYRHLDPLPTTTELNEFYKDRFDESTPSPNFSDKMNSIIEIVGKAPGKRILDVGAWDGDFLDMFDSLEWERVGIEPSNSKKEKLQAKGIRVHTELFDRIDLSVLGTFDVINLSFVLEHTLFPHDILKDVFEKLLKPGGIICVEVPNDFNPLQLAIINDPDIPLYWLSSPDHINYFDVPALEKLLEKAGFKVRHKEASFPVELFVLMGENYIGNNEVGKIIHKKRCDFEKKLERAGMNDLKRKLYESLACLNIGRSIVMLAQKI